MDLNRIKINLDKIKEQSAIKTNNFTFGMSPNKNYENMFGNMNISITREKMSMVYFGMSQVKDNKLTYQDVLNQLKNIPFVCPYDYYTSIPQQNRKSFCTSREIEDRKIPLLSFAFYLYFYKFEKIPTYNEMVGFYLNTFCYKVDDWTYAFNPMYMDPEHNFQFKIYHLEGRIFRVYYSFIREVLFLYRMLEFDSLEAFYCFQLDMNGIDLIIEDKETGFMCAFAEFANTDRSVDFKQQKDSVRHVVGITDFPIIELTADISESSNKMVTVNKGYIFNDDFATRLYFDIKNNRLCDKY